MSSTTFFVALFAIFSNFVVADEHPYCYQVGTKLYGKNLDGLCVHHTANFAVAFDVVDGMVEIDLPQGVFPRLEIYSEARIFNETEDCCPPDSFKHEIECEVKCPEDHPLTTVVGECCYTETDVFVSGLPDDAGCLHSIEDYATYLPYNNTMSWSTQNPGANGEVEVYGSLMPDGCCGCFQYSIPCSPCHEDSLWEEILEWVGLD